MLTDAMREEVVSGLLDIFHDDIVSIIMKKEMDDNTKREFLNRSYYAVFHAMRALNILKGFDSSKHSGVIAFFNKEYLKTELLDRKLSVIIKNSSFLREKSDYDDFFIAGKKDAEMQVEDAKKFMQAVRRYLEKEKNEG